mmetsp:Transcript_34197/g.72813  ORF Transcript_34197/g.72813 Transcript_34197/m.72813 type:complete len:292 (+) Transcript_34197:349-1224(+)
MLELLGGNRQGFGPRQNSQDLSGSFLSDSELSNEGDPHSFHDATTGHPCQSQSPGGLPSSGSSSGLSRSPPSPGLLAANGEPQQEQQHWLLRLGSQSSSHARQRRDRNRYRPKFFDWDRGRHAILAFRLTRPYLIYCFVVSASTCWLLVWNVMRGLENHWNLPQWKHHPAEEVVELAIGTCIVLETLFTMAALGLRAFCTSLWCLFDLLVALLTVVSMGFGLRHLGRKGEVAEADVPLLLIRFILQPSRVVALGYSTWRTQQIQNNVRELRVDFDAVAAHDPSSQSFVELT